MQCTHLSLVLNLGGAPNSGPSGSHDLTSVFTLGDRVASRRAVYPPFCIFLTTDGLGNAGFQLQGQGVGSGYPNIFG